MLQFVLPPQGMGGGFMTFAKQVRSSVFGGSPDSLSWVAMSVVPMGWINSVSLMQTVVRQLVFVESEIPLTSEISKMKRFPEDPSASLVYLDSYDEIRKIDASYGELLEGKESERHKRFAATCKRFGLSLNTGKRLAGAVKGSLQGGTLDGVRGTFHASADKQASLLGYGLMLLSQEQVSEFELRHFAGKALFNMAFRRPAMSIFESVFYDIEALSKSGGPGFLSPASRDEIFMVLSLTPLLRMNLRAKVESEVTVTDASPSGAGGGVSSTLKREPDTVDHDGTTCFYCEGAISRGAYPCPSECRATLCSLECMWRHRGMDCKRRGYPVAKFGERFSGPKHPLSEAVGQAGLIEVQPPYDLTLGHNFFSDDGRSRLEELERDPDLFAEHWAPCCKLFTRARGRPITLSDGEVVAGPQPVRDHRNLMGFPWLGREMKQRLRHSNTMANRSLARLREAEDEERIATLEHPYNSWLWEWNQVPELERQFNYGFSIGSMCCFGGRREKWFGLLGNSPEVHSQLHQPDCPGHEGLLGYGVRRDSNGQLIFDTAEEAEYPPGWCQAYAKGLRQAVEKRGRHLEAVYEGRKSWIMQELQESTERLKEETTARLMAGDVVRLEKAMAA